MVWKPEAKYFTVWKEGVFLCKYHSFEEWSDLPKTGQWEVAQVSEIENAWGKFPKRPEETLPLQMTY